MEDRIMFFDSRSYNFQFQLFLQFNNELVIADIRSVTD